MTNQEAMSICATLIEITTESNFPRTVESKINMGYTGPEVEEAVKVLCDEAGMDPIFGPGDFSV